MRVRADVYQHSHLELRGAHTTLGALIRTHECFVCACLCAFVCVCALEEHIPGPPTLAQRLPAQVLCIKSHIPFLFQHGHVLSTGMGSALKTRLLGCFIRRALCAYLKE